jgi:NADPH2:quinone reductase
MNQTLPDTMRAAIRDDTGLAFARIARPTPGAEDVLVQVHAVALNRADLGVLAGHKHGSIGGPGTVLGMEWAGVVVQAGEKVTKLKPGDRVMGSGAAAFAEYAVSHEGRVHPIPASLDFVQATTLPVALQTMHDALVTNGRLKAGESVLIQGASSGVGLMGLQIARHLGAAVVIGSSTNPERRERLREFGADLAIDSSDPDWPEQVREATGGRGVDLIIDQLSGSTLNASMSASAIRGRIVNVGRLAGVRAEFNFDLHALKRIDYIGVTFRTRSVEEVAEIGRRMWRDLEPAVTDGTLALPISATFPFEQLADAFAMMSANRHFGKISVVLQAPRQAPRTPA